MGQVIPFIARVRDSGDWTAAERARLEELAARLSDAGTPVEVMFGATDAGDPWCAVIDEGGEVLIHVARIGARFVIHSAVDDVLIEGADLHAALRERLNAEVTPENEDAVVVPFSLAGRQAQTFIALLIAASFFYETVDPTPAMAAVAPVTPMEVPPEDAPPADLVETIVERDITAQVARLAETAGALPDPAPLALSEAPPEPTVTVATLAMELPALAAFAAALAAETGVAVAASAAAARVLRGGGGDDRIVGSAEAEWISGGDGDDTLVGGGGRDTLDGGAGDDSLEVTAEVVAAGGQGADTFVIADPLRMGQADTFLGTILDFSALAGDRLVNSRGQQVTSPGDEAESEPQAPQVDELAPATLGPSSTSNEKLVRVEVDLDGDGAMDGYILVLKSGSASAGRPPPKEEEEEGEPSEEAPPATGFGEDAVTADLGLGSDWSQIFA